MNQTAEIQSSMSEHDELAEPPMADVPANHPLWPEIAAALREVYDPEIPVNLYELGLIYKVEIKEAGEDDKHDIYIQMSLTSPGCPVAQEMPFMVQRAVTPLEKAGLVEVDLVWDPPWNPSMMAETARLQLNMFA